MKTIFYHIKLAIAVSCLCAVASAFADNPAATLPPLPAAGTNVPPTAEEFAQFQQWLKNNGTQQVAATPSTTSQSPAADAAPLAPTPTAVPPPPSSAALPDASALAPLPQPQPQPQQTSPVDAAAATPPADLSQLQPPEAPPITTATPARPYHSQPIVSQTGKIRLPEPPKINSHVQTLEQSQNVMMSSVPPSAPPSADAIAAFNSMMQQNIPLTPQQVVRLRQLIDVSQRAAAIPATVPPKPVSSTLIINQAPGATPPAIRLAQGYVSSLVFVDSTGAPWPIAGYEIGDPKATNIQWDGKSNVLLMQAVSPYGDSNMVVRLIGLTTPVTLELVAGQRVVDYRADIHVTGLGPNAKETSIGQGIPPSANQLLLDVLDGVAPVGGKTLSVRGGDCQAWLQGDKMYLRTRMTLLSPAWGGRMVSPDGMNAYEIPKTSSVLVSQYGEPVELKVEGF